MVLTVSTFIYDFVQLILAIIRYTDDPVALGITCGLIGWHMGISSYLIVIVYSFR